MGDPWHTQDLSAGDGTPAIDPGTQPVAFVHDGYTSVYTVDANHDLQETYLRAIGDDWVTQDFTTDYGMPAVASGMTPIALYHGGYASVYTVDQSNNDVQETYLPAVSDKWTSQDLSSKYGTPAANQPPSVLEHGDTTGAPDLDQHLHGHQVGLGSRGELPVGHRGRLGRPGPLGRVRRTAGLTSGGHRRVGGRCAAHPPHAFRQLLVTTIRAYIASWNTDTRPFPWTATTGEILAKVRITQLNIKKLVANNAK